jgi:hypothetical protein
MSHCGTEALARFLGYPSRYTILKDYVRTLRKRPARRAHLRFEPDPDAEREAAAAESRPWQASAGGLRPASPAGHENS